MTTNAGQPISGIAVIGMACRFPGSSSVEEFWQNLVAGVESIRALSNEDLQWMVQRLEPSSAPTPQATSEVRPQASSVIERPALAAPEPAGQVHAQRKSKSIETGSEVGARRRHPQMEPLSCVRHIPLHGAFRHKRRGSPRRAAAQYVQPGST